MVQRERDRQLDEGEIVALGKPGERVGPGELALVAVERDVETARDQIRTGRHRLLTAHAIPPGQPPGRERTVADHANAVLLYDRKHLTLHTTDQQ